MILFDGDSPEKWHLFSSLLVALAPSIPDQAARIVREVVRGEADPMLLTYEGPALRAIIVAARAASGSAMEPTIQDTLGMLAAKGCTGFLDLSAPRPADGR